MVSTRASKTETRFASIGCTKCSHWVGYVFPDSAISVDLLTEGKRQTVLRSSGDLVFDKVAAVWSQDSRVFEVRIADSISESQTFFAFHMLEKRQINPSTLKH
jgi:hypothetical protein